MTEDTDPITSEDVVQNEMYGSLGPGYFAARRFTEKLLADFEAEHFKPLVDKFTEQLNNSLWTAVSDSLVTDTEYNVQAHIYRTVDQIVLGLLSGEQWVMNKYVLGPRYDCEKVRATVAKYVPEELQNQRIKELELENENLQERIKWFQR